MTIPQLAVITVLSGFACYLCVLTSMTGTQTKTKDAFAGLFAGIGMLCVIAIAWKAV